MHLQANQKMSKAALLKDLYLEIERMKADVRAARGKNGVCVPHERYAHEEAEKARIEKIEQLENDLNHREKKNLENKSKALLDLQENHRAAIPALKKKEFIISKELCSEKSLIERAKELQNASEDITTLFSKLEQKDMMEAENQSLVLYLSFDSQLDQSLKDLHKTSLWSVSQLR